MVIGSNGREEEMKEVRQKTALNRILARLRRFPNGRERITTILPIIRERANSATFFRQVTNSRGRKYPTTPSNPTKIL